MNFSREAASPLRRAGKASLVLTAAVIGLALPGTLVAIGAAPAFATTTVLYAYATGAATPSGCPAEAGPTTGCSLAQALAVAAAGDDIYLATPGSSGSYVGNWVVSTTGTSSGSPLTIEPAPGVSGPVLDGNGGSSVGCTTSTCDEQVLTVGTGVYLNLDDLTVQDADDTTYPNGVSSQIGGAVYSLGSLSVSGSTFLNNTDPGAGPGV